jgi:hypothetical protein
MNWKNKKKVIVCFVWLMILSGMAATVSANAPQSLSIEYNSETQILTVDIDHQVSDPTTHYIFQVVIKKNSETYNISTYTSQPSSTSFSYTYQVVAIQNDTLDVTASCIQGGSKTTQITVGGSVSATNNNKSTPGFELVVFAYALICIFVFQRYKKR